MSNNTEIIAEDGKLELFIIREFDAPRELVFRANTEKDLYEQWVGPDGMSTVVEKMDAVDGGSYRFLNEHEGQQYAFRGVYHEVLAPERFIGTFEFEGMPERGHVILGTTKFEDLGGGRCRMVHQSVFQSVEDRDGMIRSGMERGVVDGYNKLDSLLEALKERSTAA